MVTKNFNSLLQITSLTSMAFHIYDTGLICQNSNILSLSSLDYSNQHIQNLTRNNTYTFEDIDMVAKIISRMSCDSYFRLIGVIPIGKFELSDLADRYSEIKNMVAELWRDNALISTGVLPLLTEALMSNIESYFKIILIHLKKATSEALYNEIIGDKLISKNLHLLTETFNRLNKAGISDITELKDLLDYLFERSLYDGIIMVLKNQQVKEILISLFFWLRGNMDEVFYNKEGLGTFLRDPHDNNVQFFYDLTINLKFKDDLMKFWESFKTIYWNLSTKRSNAIPQIVDLIQIFLTDLSLYSGFRTISGMEFPDLPTINFDSIVFDNRDLFEVRKSISILYNFIYLSYISSFRDYDVNSASTQQEVNDSLKNIIYGLYVLPFTYDQIRYNFPNTFND